MPVSLIILAAGSSSRMGQSKQLMPWKNETLLNHMINTAIESRVGHVYVVLGSDEVAHRKSIGDLPVTIVSNPSWKNGMGSSLKAGLNAAKDSEAVLFMVCDMPFITSQHLNNIIEHYEKTNQHIVASKYLEAVGVPALFDKALFGELSQISDDEGARKLIVKYKKAAAIVYLKSGADIDTPEDYRNAINDQ